MPADEINLMNYAFSGETRKTAMEPTKQENNAYANVMFGALGPLTMDVDERDAKIAKVVKDAAARNAKNAKLRGDNNGTLTPAAIANNQKEALFRLRQIAKNAEVRLNHYGVPDVRAAQKRIDATLKARKVAANNGALNAIAAYHRRAMMKKKPSLLTLRCPTCGAKRGEKCELGSGQPRTSLHTDRRVIANGEHLATQGWGPLLSAMILAD
jgi:hypothetical protein